MFGVGLLGLWSPGLRPREQASLLLKPFLSASLESVNGVGLQWLWVRLAHRRGYCD